MYSYFLIYYLLTEIAIGKGLSREALQIHDLIQELLLSEADTEILVDELTRFSPKLREKNLNVCFFMSQLII